jgi:hypothetical protein
VVELFLAAAPTLLIVSLAGYGAAGGAIFVRKGSGDQSWDLFESGFVGVFLIAAGTLVSNFFVSLGTNSGPYVLFSGVALFAIFQWRNRFQWNQLHLLIFVVSIVSCKPGNIELGYDTGLYHMSFMNWVAYQPAPLGLAHQSA